MVAACPSETGQCQWYKGGVFDFSIFFDLSLSLSLSLYSIRRHDSDVYLGMSPVQNGGSYLMY